MPRGHPNQRFCPGFRTGAIVIISNFPGIGPGERFIMTADLFLELWEVTGQNLIKNFFDQLRFMVPRAECSERSIAHHDPDGVPGACFRSDQTPTSDPGQSEI